MAHPYPRFALFPIIAGLLTATVYAQPGSNDPTFNPGDAGFGTGDGFQQGEVIAHAVLPDGKIVVAGDFQTYNGEGPGYLVRLNPDGSRDHTFDTGSGPDSWVSSVVPLPDGKFIIAGAFYNYNGVSVPRIIRLNADGSRDNQFGITMPTNYYAASVLLQPDGKLVAGGNFWDNDEAGLPHLWTARYNADGSLDGSFLPATGDPGFPLEEFIVDMALQTDGKIVVGGWFTEVNGTARNNIARLNSDGTVDPTFDPGTGADALVRELFMQPDGKVLVGGQFTHMNGVPLNRIARLLGDGSVDTGFSVGTGISGPQQPDGASTVWEFALRTDGRILVAGEFTDFNGTPRGGLTQLLSDGALDASFNVSVGFQGQPYAYTLSVLDNDQVLVGGYFTSYQSVGVSPKMVRLNADASLDATFNPVTGVNGTVFATAVQPDGKLLIAGEFTLVNGTARKGIARLLADGSVDPAFDPGSGFQIDNGGQPISLVVQPDGKVLMASGYTEYDGTPINWVVRMNPDGSIDPTFTAAIGGGPLALQPDGKIIVGRFRLNNDGSLDNSFNADQITSQVRAVLLQPDGKIIVGGGTYSDSPALFARLNTDGTLDPTFNTGGGIPDGPIYALVLRTDGKVLAGGAFQTFNGTSRSRIVQVNADGSLDMAFDPGSGFDHAVSDVNVMALAQQADGRVVAGGLFTEYDGNPRNSIARLNVNGELDASFDPGSGFYVWPFATRICLALQPDHAIVAGGDFTSYNGIGRNRIARLLGGSLVDCLGVENGSALPGTVCDDGMSTTGNDVYGSDCICSGLLIDCTGIIGGGALPGASCDDGDPGTGNDVYDGNCLCAGLLIDCEGVAGGPALPGTVCDDGNANTTDDLYTAECVCIGTPPFGDCEGVPGGNALPGTACNDCDPTTFNDVYDPNCICGGVPSSGTAFQTADLDPSFDPGSGFTGGAGNLALQPDGKVIVSGSFTAFDGTTRNHIARINADGSLDAGYAVGTGFNGLRTTDLALQPDGKVLVSGEFTMYDGMVRNSIARLKTDGTLDATFNPGSGFDPYSYTTALALQPNGKVLVAGYFNSYNGAPAGDLVRLNAAGTLDPSFDIGLGFDYEAFAPGVQSGVPELLRLQPDGRLLVVGGISWYDGLSPLVGDICRGIARLDQLGGFDHTFQYGDDWWDETEGFNDSPEAVALLDDGRMYIGGDFTAYYGDERNRIIRLNADGTLDPTFDPGTGFNDEVTALAIQPDGRILVGGNFTAYQGAPRERIARLNPDGSLDAGFQPCEGFNGTVRDLALQPDGRLIVTGDFTSYGGVARHGIARLYTVDATCIASQLTTTADPVISCGAVNLKFDGTSTISATEVPGANKYQFRFTNIPGQPAYARNIAWPTRSFTLTKWYTSPLKAGRTYDVMVRASFDDGATWCDWGPSCTVHVSSSPLAPGMLREMEETALEVPELLVYPNPTNGDQLRIELSGADLKLTSVALDLTDLFGKRVMTATLPLQDGEVNTVLSLNTDLSVGLYILTITAGEQVFNERVVITR